MHLQKYREAAGLTQTDLANEVGLTRQAISLLEARKRQPKHATAAAIARVLHTDADTIWPPPPRRLIPKRAGVAHASHHARSAQHDHDDDDDTDR